MGWGPWATGRGGGCLQKEGPFPRKPCCQLQSCQELEPTAHVALKPEGTLSLWVIQAAYLQDPRTQR